MAAGGRAVSWLHFEFGFNPFFDFGRFSFHLKLVDEHWRRRGRGDVEGSSSGRRSLYTVPVTVRVAVRSGESLGFVLEALAMVTLTGKFKLRKLDQKTGYYPMN